MKKSSILKITSAAVMTALITVLTMIVNVPSPTKGYFNLGDPAVLFAGWLLGPIWGPVAGGLGSAFADFFAGYPVYAPVTFIIKALMALIVSLASRFFADDGKILLRIVFLAAAIVAEALMIGGYYLYEAIVLGEGFIAALAGVAGNAVQGAVGIVGSYILIESLSHTGVFKYYGARGFAK